MKTALNRMYIGAKIRIFDFMDNLKNDETGVSTIVATVLLILVVVLLASLFWDNISKWFSDTWDKIINADRIPT